MSHQMARLYDENDQAVSEKLQTETIGPEDLFHLDNEEAILECLEASTPETVKHKSRNALHENLLHFFARKDFDKAILKLLYKFLGFYDFQRCL